MMSTIQNFLRSSKKHFLLIVFMIPLSLGLINCGGGGGGGSSSSSSSSSSSNEDSSNDSTDNSDNIRTTDTTTATEVSLSGKAVANGEDVAAVATLSEKAQGMFAKLNPFQFSWASTETGSSDNEALANATVTLHKIYSDDDAAEEEVDIGEVTTDSAGDFTIDAIPTPPQGSGSDSDFYYEVRISKGDLTLRSPAAPRTSTATVNVSPETHLAANILSDVVKVPHQASSPSPSARTIESMREMVLSNAGTLVDNGAISIPSVVGSNASSNNLSLANGLSAGGGNAEKMFKAASFEAEYMAIASSTEDDAESAAAFISRATREGCNQEQGDYMPQALADALGDFYFDEEGTPQTLTPTEIVSAYNDNSTGSSIVLADVVTAYQEMLAGVEDKIEEDAAEAEDIEDEEMIAMITKRDLDAEDFDADTALTADQVAAFIQTFNEQQCNFDNNLDLFGFMADLLDDESLRSIAVANAEIYHNSGFGCNEGAGEGHFYAEISVYEGARSVSSVVITSSDSTALGGDGTETLSLDGGMYKSNTEGVCVSLGEEVTYTVTVNFSSGDPVTSEVVRNHPRIPEASSQVLVGESFSPGADNSNNATVVDTSRPLYQWTSPDEMLTAIINDASNTGVKTELENSDIAVKYTYEFSHVDTSVQQVGPANDPACPMVSSGALYAVDSFIPTEDCDVTACAAALSIAEEDVACRMNIQSYLVDEHDKILGQAAGHFRFFCVDLDDNGECG